MRAVAVLKIGDTPELMELPVPILGPVEILVKLEAASLNPIDAGIAEGHLPMPSVFPLVLGVDGAGRVVEVGDGVRGFAHGDLVHGQFLRAPLGSGTFAEYVVVPQFPEAGALQVVPKGVSAELAAALPTAGMTALGAIESIDLKAGQSILIAGATGGVGVFAVQLAAARGANVIATARADADGWIRGLGATQTIDYTAVDVVEQVRRDYPDGVDALLDLTRDATRFTQYAELVRDGGAAVSATLTASPELVASKRIAVSNFIMQDKLDLLSRIAAEAAAGRITVSIQQAIKLDQVPEALARNMAGGARGKTTVQL
jgi:NADPH:quinone reductase-like Zn-dependent oxidoreductase